MALGVLFPIGDRETLIHSTSSFAEQTHEEREIQSVEEHSGQARTDLFRESETARKERKERKHNDACTLCALSGWLARVDDAGYEMEAFWALLLVHRKIREGQTKQLYLYSCTTRTEEIETSPGRCVRLRRCRMG
jgi:hypothetical protein